MPRRNIHGRYRIGTCRFCNKILPEKDINLHAFTCNAIYKAVRDEARLIPGKKK